MKKCIGAEFASPYITTAMLFVESIFPYTLTGILFLATFWARNWVAAPLSRVYTLMMVRYCSPFCGFTHGPDRFVVCITADVDLARGRGNCMAERHDKDANNGASVQHQR